jgi:hypothetical protein
LKGDDRSIPEAASRAVPTVVIVAVHHLEHKTLHNAIPNHCRSILHSLKIQPIPKMTGGR